jgi:uncharacterized protein
MNQLLSEFISAILQVAVFTLIPFIFFLFRKEKSIGFKKYIGFYPAPSRAMWYALGCSLLFLFAGIMLIFIDPGFKQIVLSPVSVTGKLRAMGFGATSLITLLLMALFKTSLSEEILFRGFIAKRVIHALGFTIGNIIQALIFGLVHLLLIWKLVDTTTVGLLLIFTFSSLAGWTIGLIKEKHGRGSIIPGWLAHGLGNTISYFIIAFVI